MRSIPFTPERLAHLRMQGAAIARARRRNGLTQQQTADLFGASVNTVAKWEIGLRACPPEVCRKIVAEWGGDEELLGPGADVCPHCKRRW